MRRLQASVLAAIAAALPVPPATVSAAPGDITPVSVRPVRPQRCMEVLSSDLRFVAFGSYEALVKTDLNTALSQDGAVDIYVQERAPLSRQ